MPNSLDHTPLESNTPKPKLSLKQKIEANRGAGYGAMLGAVTGAIVMGPLAPIGAIVGGAVGGGIGSFVDRTFRRKHEDQE